MVDAAAQVGQGAPTRLGAGRKRNTSTNMGSKQSAGSIFGGAAATEAVSGGDLPTLDPSAVSNYYGQLQTLQSTLMNTIAQLRNQRVGMRGEARVQRADIKQQGQAAIAAGINEDLDRGMLGSSADYKKRIEGRAAIAGGIADVNRGLHDALAESRFQAAAARLSATQGAQALASGAISSRMGLAAQEQQNQIAIQIAQMQARAARISSNAQMSLAEKQLRADRQTAQALRDLANNPNPYAPVTTEHTPLWQTGGPI